MVSDIRGARRMNDIIIISAVIIAVGAVVFSAVSVIKTRRILKNIHKMLDDAISGSFIENRFDETELSALENKLWKYLSSSEISAKKTAEEKEKIKTLISDISHQTKTPIANIRLYSELLSEEAVSENEKDYAEKITAQSEKLSFLITSLVKLSRLETGVISLSPKENNVSKMLADIELQAEPKAKEKGLSLSFSHNGEKAVFDEKWTGEALWNIIDNAIKYTEKGGISVTVKSYEMFLCIEISDTGIGISEEEQAQIFSRFYRSSDVKTAEGAGIGLYLAREIITGENGYIKLSSEKGKGSVFSVFLSKL